MRSEKGAILIEAIIGLTIAIIIITGLVTALVSSLSNSTFSRAQTIATGYGQEYMELLRSYKDDDYGAIEVSAPLYPAAMSNNYILLTGPNPGLRSGINQITNDSSGIPFDRTIYLSRNKLPECPNSIYAQVDVSWQDGKCENGIKCHKVSLKSCLSNLDYVPLP